MARGTVPRRAIVVVVYIVTCEFLTHTQAVRGYVRRSLEKVVPVLTATRICLSSISSRLPIFLPSTAFREQHASAHGSTMRHNVGPRKGARLLTRVETAHGGHHAALLRNVLVELRPREQQKQKQPRVVCRWTKEGEGEGEGQPTCSMLRKCFTRKSCLLFAERKEKELVSTAPTLGGRVSYPLSCFSPQRKILTLGGALAWVPNFCTCVRARMRA